jgi:hypothetical protein
MSLQISRFQGISERQPLQGLPPPPYIYGLYRRHPLQIIPVTSFTSADLMVAAQRMLHYSH